MKNSTCRKYGLCLTKNCEKLFYYMTHALWRHVTEQSIYRTPRTSAQEYVRHKSVYGSSMFVCSVFWEYLRCYCYYCSNNNIHSFYIYIHRLRYTFIKYIKISDTYICGHVQDMDCTRISIQNNNSKYTQLQQQQLIVKKLCQSELFQKDYWTELSRSS